MRISRLVLHTPPLGEAEARELAQRVAEDLAGLTLRAAGDVRIEVAPGDASVDAATLREQIIAAVAQALGAPAPSGTKSTDGPAARTTAGETRS